jgi:enterochelin esterase family protein
MPPAIFAVPDCMTRLGGSQYLDSPGTGRYETYVCDELIPALDRQYRTIPRREARAVVGKSSGGYGALRLAMRRGELFGAAASHSGDCYFEICHGRDFPSAVNSIAKAGGVAALVRKVRGTEKPSHDDMIALMTIAMAACYSPNAAKRGRLKLDLPFDVKTGEILTEVFHRWLPNDPVRMVDAPKHAAALRRLRVLFLDCGIRDQWFLHLGLRVLVRKLERLRVKVVHEEFDDDHMSISYRYDRSLPLLVKHLDKE